MRVAVIGAGVIGAAVARELAGRGVDVTIFERDRPGAGTSGTTFAWVNAHAKQPDSYHRLNLEGCAEHRRFALDTPRSESWWFPTGNLEWADDEGRDALDRRTARLDELGYQCRDLEPAEARRLEPDALVPDDASRIVFFPEEGHVLPTALLAALLGDALDRGTTLRCATPVASVQPGGGRTGAEVVLEDGERIGFDRVVSCVGRWSQQLLGDAVPLADPDHAGGPAVGFLAYTSPLPTRLARLLTTPRLNVRPDGGGRLVLQGLDLDAGADPASPPSADPSLAATVRGRLAGVLARGETATVEGIRVGQRALPADGLTVAGPIDGASSLYAVATHSGVTLGPLLGRLVAQEVTEAAESPLLRDFRPSRFIGTVGSGDQLAAARRPGEQ